MNERGDILVARPQRSLGAGAAGTAGAKSALVVAPATAAAMPGGAWPEELLVGAGRNSEVGMRVLNASRVMQVGDGLLQGDFLACSNGMVCAFRSLAVSLAHLPPCCLASPSLQELFMRHAVLPKAEGARPSEWTATGGLHRAAAVCITHGWASGRHCHPLHLGFCSHYPCPLWARMLT